MYQNQSGFKRKTGLEPATSTYSHDEQENFIVLALNGADEILFSKSITKGIGNKTLAPPLMPEWIAIRVASTVSASSS